MKKRKRKTKRIKQLHLFITLEVFEQIQMAPYFEENFKAVVLNA